MLPPTHLRVVHECVETPSSSHLNTYENQGPGCGASDMHGKMKSLTTASDRISPAGERNGHGHDHAPSRQESSAIHA